MYKEAIAYEKLTKIILKWTQNSLKIDHRFFHQKLNNGQKQLTHNTRVLSFAQNSFLLLVKIGSYSHRQSNVIIRSSYLLNVCIQNRELPAFPTFGCKCISTVYVRSFPTCSEPITRKVPKWNNNWKQNKWALKHTLFV